MTGTVNAKRNGYIGQSGYFFQVPVYSGHDIPVMLVRILKRIFQYRQKIRTETVFRVFADNLLHAFFPPDDQLLPGLSSAIR